MGMALAAVKDADDAVVTDVKRGVEPHIAPSARAMPARPDSRTRIRDSRSDAFQNSGSLFQVLSAESFGEPREKAG